MSSLGTIWAELGISLDKFDQGLRSAEASIKTTEDKLLKGFNDIGKRMTQAGKQLSMTVTLPLTLAAGAAVKLSTDFETTMTRLVTLAGVAEGQMNEWADSLRALAPAVGQTPQALAEALYAVTSAGLRGAEALDVVRASGQAAAVGLGDATTIARTLTAAMAAYGAENLSAGEAADILVAAVREGNMEADALSGSLGRVIGISAQVGVSFADVNGFIATFTRLGVDAEEATTALRGVLTTILKPSKEAGEALATVGLTVEDLRISIKEKGLTATLIDLVAAFKGNEEGLALVIPNVRALAGVLGTAGSQAGAFDEVTRKITNSQGTLAEAFARVSETAGFQFAQLKSELANLSIAVGGVLTPVLLDLINNYVKPLVVEFAELDEGTKKTILVLAGVAAAAGPVLVVLGLLAQTVVVVSAAKAILSGIMTKSLIPALARVLAGIQSVFVGMGPIGWALLALTAVVTLVATAWTNDWGHIREVTAGVVDWLKGAWAAFADWFAGAWVAFKAFFREWGPYLLAALAGPLGPIVLAVVRNWDAIKEGAVAAITATLGFFRELPGRIWEYICGLPAQLASWASNLGSGIWQGFKDAMGIHSPSHIEQALTDMADTASFEFDRMLQLMGRWEAPAREAALRAASVFKLIPEEVKKAVDATLATLDYLGSEAELAFKLWQLTVGTTATETAKLTRELAYQQERLQELAAAIPDLEAKLRLVEQAFGADSEEARKLRLELLSLKIEQAEFQIATTATTEALEKQVGALKDLVIQGDRVRLLVEGAGGKNVWLDIPRQAKREYSADEQAEIAAIATRQGVDLSVAESMFAANKVAQWSDEVPAYAAGGILNSPTLAWIAETPRARPEVVAPLGDLLGIIRQAVAPLQAGPVTMIVELDGRVIARMTAPHLVRELRLKGVPA